MKYNNLSKASSEVKRMLLRGIIEGTIKKEEMAEIESSVLLLGSEPSLVHIVMGETESYSVNGRQVTKEEFEKLSKIAKTLGIQEENVNFNIEPIKSDIPLSSSEEEVRRREGFE